METKKKLTLNTVAILLMFMTSAGGTYENAAIQTTIDAWPAVAASAIRMMVTLPTITSTIAMVFIGGIVGKKISYRGVNALALICSIVGGIVPFFYYPSWTFVLVMRAILGVGVGCYCIRNPMLVKSVAPAELAKYIGWGGVINNAFSVVINPVVGAMTNYGWRYALLSNFIIVFVGIVALIGLKEPAHEEAVQADAPREKARIPGMVYFYMIVQFIATMVLYPLLSGMSTFVVNRNLGSATVAGSLISIYMFSGVVVNLILPKVQKIFGLNTLLVAFAVTAIGAAGVLYIPSFAAIAVAVFISGVGFMTVFSMLQVLNGLACDSKSVAFCSTLILAANQLGVFCSSYFITASNVVFHQASDIESSFLGCCVVYLLLAVICFLFRSKVYPKAAQN